MIRAAVFLLLVVSFRSFASTTLTAENAVDQALASNAFLEASTSRIAAAEGLRVQSGLRPNPRLFLQSENTRAWGPGPFRYLQDTDNFVTLSQIVELGSKRRNRLEASNENVRSSELNRNVLKSQIAGRVLSAYWYAVGAQRLEAALSESFKALEQTVQYHRDRVEQGSLPESDLVRIQVEAQQVNISYKNSQQDTARARLQLFREMGIAEPADTVLVGELELAPSLLAVDLEQAIERRPDVRLAAQAVLQAQAFTRVQQAISVPDPEVIFGYKRTAGLDTLVGGVQINLPVRNRNQGAIAAAGAEEAAAAASLRAVRMAARTEIVAVEAETRQKHQVVKELLPALRQQAADTSRIANAVYREGASDLLRLLDAERVRIQAETLYVRTLIDYRLAAVALQIAAGLLP